MEGEQGNGKKTERNDRLVAVDIANHQWQHIRRVDDLGKQFVEEIEEFFVNYHELTGKENRIRGVKGPGAARMFLYLLALNVTWLTYPAARDFIQRLKELALADVLVLVLRAILK
jgi:peptidoglycan/xylan/chitin deacetylase (PgdA/CDA1 family)